MGAATHPVVVSAVHVPGHPKVPDFHQEVLTNQAVAGGQISVHEVLGRQVDHARGYLLGDVQHLGLGQLCWWIAFGHQHGVRPMGPVEDTEVLLEPQLFPPRALSPSSSWDSRAA